MPSSMWEKRISHPGLKAYRVVRGQTQQDADIKAALQIELWDERWRRAQEKQAAARLSSSVYDLTKEAERHHKKLATILLDSLKKSHRMDWEKEKRYSLFPGSPPPPPSLHQLPPKPVREVVRVAVLDWIWPGRRASRNRKADERIRSAEEAWRGYCEGLENQNQQMLDEHRDRVAQWTASCDQFQKNQADHNARIEIIHSAYGGKQLTGLEWYWNEILSRSEYPDNFPREYDFDYAADSRTLIINYELPAPEAIPRLKEVKYVAARRERRDVLVSDSWVKRTYDAVLYQISLRTLYELFESDATDALTNIVFNGFVSSIDRATGLKIHPCIISIEAEKEAFLSLDLSNVDSKTCFKKFKGISASTLADLMPVRPVLQLNRSDRRFVESYNLADTLSDSTNLAAMDWLDFENLIREVFEKEFSQNGGEVKITQASRDGGVDAIAFDPDPIRGGKIVIQAKRYTNVVGVSAVRDLFGTVHGEGAIKGILVTTSSYGPDAYEYAKDKPLTLLNGGELLYLLRKHGHHARIDLPEAKRLVAEQFKSAHNSDPF